MVLENHSLAALQQWLLKRQWPYQELLAGMMHQIKRQTERITAAKPAASQTWHDDTNDVMDTSVAAWDSTLVSRHDSKPQLLSSQELKLVMLLQFSSEGLVSAIAVSFSSSFPSPSSVGTRRSNCWT